MLHLFSLTGQPSEKHYLLMNGDLVDRGSWSIEVILTAFAFKCKITIYCTLSPVRLINNNDRALSQIHVHKSR